MIGKEIVNREFFIIDSDNLSEVKDKLYGFGFNNNNLILSNRIKECKDLENIGAYVLIKRINDEIIISQDFSGSYGLYLYQKDDYFAISNSFIKLVEYLKANHELTLNEDYALYSLIPRTLSSLVYKETLINEINEIDRNKIIKINVSSKEIIFESINYEENSINIASEEGLKLLDSWFFKWIEIIRSINKKTNNISIDLSGGLDTRMVLALVLNANIDMNRIKVHSLTNKRHNHDEDFRIASQIADEYGFELNRSLNVNYINYPDVETLINLSCYVKLGFANQFNFKLSYPEDPIYRITGNGGESIRGWVHGNSQTFIKGKVNEARKVTYTMIKPVQRILNRSANNLINNFNIDDNHFQEANYRETRLRNHFGKLAVENYLSNYISLSPLIDPNLFKLKFKTDECDDNLLLMIVMLVRYCPKLLEFEVEGGREFNEDTIEYAKKINMIYPFKSKEHPLISNEDSKKIDIEDTSNKLHINEIGDYLIKIFESNSFKYEFKKYSPPKVYDSILKSVKNRDYFPIQDMIPAFALIYIIHLIEYDADFEIISDWFNSFLDDKYNGLNPQMDLMNNPELKLLLSNFITARIDIKNLNRETNSIELLENSDKLAWVSFPNWLHDEYGSGCVIKSLAGKLNLKFKCIGDGELVIKLRSINSFDKNKNHYPIYIDYTRFAVNDSDIIEESKLAWHDNPFVYKVNVKDSDIIDIDVEWMPISRNSVLEHHELISDLKNLKRKNIVIQQLENNKTITKIKRQLKARKYNIIHKTCFNEK